MAVWTVLVSTQNISAIIHILFHNTRPPELLWLNPLMKPLLDIALKSHLCSTSGAMEKSESL